MGVEAAAVVVGAAMAITETHHCSQEPGIAIALEAQCRCPNTGLTHTHTHRTRADFKGENLKAFSQHAKCNGAFGTSTMVRA
jgi:hypothetical protein